MKRLTLTLISLLTLAPGLMAQPLCELPEIEPPVVADDDELAALLANYADEADALARAIPETSRDLFAVLTETDLTPEGLNTWVADNTALVAYRGVLRGAEGVIADRHGNSLDRALLLAELVELAGYDVRLARAELTVAQLTILTEQMTASPVVDPLPGLDLDEAPPDVLALLSGELSPEAQACRDAVQARLDEQVTALSGLLEQAGVDARASDIEQSLSDHWWVQYFDGADWLDLDPEAMNASIGETLMVAELPGELLHKVSLELGVDVVSASGSKQTQVLSYEAPARDLLTASLSLSFQPLGFSPEPGEPDGDNFIAELIEHDQWLALLRVNSDQQPGMTVTLDGTVQDFSAEADATMQLAEGIRSATDTFLGGALENLGNLEEGGGETPGNEPGELNAAYLRLTLTRPEAEPFVAERRLFDLGLQPDVMEINADAAMQRAAGLLTNYDVLVNPAAAGGGARLARVAADMADYFRAMESMARMKDDSLTEDAFNQLVQNLTRVPLPLEPLGLMRIAAGGTDAVPIGANVILQRQQQTGADGGLVELEIDIVSNSVAGAAAPETAYARRLEQGVRDTILEDLLLGSEAQEAANTSRVFARDLTAGRTWRLLAASDAGDQPAAARAALEAGYLVVAPPQAGSNAEPYAYWRIDPVTGTTLGIGPYGAGATMGEYAGLLTNVAVTGLCFYKTRDGSQAAKLGCVIASLGTLAGGIGLAAGMMEGAGSIVAAAHWATAIFTALGGAASMAD